MNRRSFLKRTAFGGAGLLLGRGYSSNLKTKHLIFIVNGSGARKKEYYENSSISPNIARLAKEGFVFEEDHCDTAASHRTCFEELIQRFPDYVHKAYGDEPTKYWHIKDGSLTPRIMKEFSPRILIFHETRHDAGHGGGGHPRAKTGYEEYLDMVKETDETVGRIADWVRTDPYFSKNTAIVIRAEFGRDDEVNVYGELHHSHGYYYTHRVASIYWGPDFNSGVDRTTVVNRRDIAPTLTRLFNVDLPYSRGRILPGLFRPEADVSASM